MLSTQTGTLESLVLQHISLSFDRKKSRFSLLFKDLKVEQNVCEFLLTSSFLVGQDIEQYLMSTDSRYDTVKVPLTTAGKSITIGLSDFIQIRELYGRQLYLLKLEEMLMHRGISLSA